MGPLSESHQGKNVIGKLPSGASDAGSANRRTSAESAHPSLMRNRTADHNVGTGRTDRDFLRIPRHARGHHRCHLMIQPARTTFVIEFQRDESRQMEQQTDERFDHRLTGRSASGDIDDRQPRPTQEIAPQERFYTDGSGGRTIGPENTSPTGAASDGDNRMRPRRQLLDPAADRRRLFFPKTRKIPPVGSRFVKDRPFDDQDERSDAARHLLQKRRVIFCCFGRIVRGNGDRRMDQMNYGKMGNFTKQEVFQARLTRAERGERTAVAATGGEPDNRPFIRRQPRIIVRPGIHLRQSRIRVLRRPFC